MSVRDASGPEPEELVNLMELTALELERRAERLLRLSRDLIAQASLHATLVSLPEERSVGRLGNVVTEEEAIKVARQLQSFSRQEFADALGLKASSVSRWLAKLIDRQHPIVERVAAGGYVYLAPVSTIKAPPKQVEVERTLITDAPKRGAQARGVNARDRKIRQEAMSVPGRGHKLRQRDKRNAEQEAARRARRNSQ